MAEDSARYPEVDASARIRRALTYQKAAKGTLWAAAVFTMLILIVIIGYIVIRGIVSVTVHEYPVIGAGGEAVTLGHAEQQHLTIIVNRKIRVRDFTMENVRDLYTGKRKNWALLSRQDLSVDAVCMDASTPLGAIFQRTVLGDDKPKRFATIVNTEEEVVEYVARTDGAVGYVSAGRLDSLEDSGVKVVRVRTIALVVNPGVTEIRDNRMLRYIKDAQIGDIFTGRITNWSELGGPDLSVQPVVFRAGSTTYNEFVSLVYGEDEASELVCSNVVDSVDELMRRLESTAGAVGFCYLTDIPAGAEVERLVIRRREVERNLTLHFLTERPRKAGVAGGISTIILNTLIMILLTIVFATPIGVFAAIYLTEYSHQGVVVRIIRFATETLAAIPSIIFGLFGFIFFVTVLKLGVGLLSGTLTIAIMILPTMIRASEEAIKGVPDAYREASFGIGATKWQTIVGVVIPAAAPGILTGIILSIGRAVGETAAVIFTLGSNYNLVDSLTSSARVLSVHLYMLVKEGISLERGFATATVLMVIVLGVNFAVAWIVSRMARAGGAVKSTTRGSTG